MHLLFQPYKEDAISIIKNNYPNIQAYSISLEIYSLNNIPLLAYNTITSINKRIFVDAKNGEIIDEIALNESATMPSEPYPTTQKDYYGLDVEVILEKTKNTDENGDYEYILADALRNIYIYNACIRLNPKACFRARHME